MLCQDRQMKFAGQYKLLLLYKWYIFIQTFYEIKSRQMPQDVLIISFLNDQIKF